MNIANQTLYLFVDTNLFIQCLPLEQLPWKDLGDFKNIEIIVTAPVIREIDYQKNKGNGRVGNKARAANALFRSAMATHNQYQVLNNDDLSVLLFLRPEYQYSNETLSSLNMSERDDQLISTIYHQTRQNPENNIVLFTHDTAPMLTAQGLNLKYLPVPSNWILTPENDTQDKKVNFLNSEIERLKKQQPDIRISCLCDEIHIQKLDAKTYYYPELTQYQVKDVLEEAKKLHPFVTSYGAREPEERELPSNHMAKLFGFKESYIPATDSDINQYKKAYEEWLSKCEDFLKNYHHILNRDSGYISVTFKVENIGIRPANDTLIRVEASGKLQIMPPAYKAEENLEEKISFPSAPKPPEGHWETVTRDGVSTKSTFDALRGLKDILGPSSFEYGPRLSLASHMPNKRDDNDFYYKNRPHYPSELFELECKQFRHSDRVEFFVCEIRPLNDANEVAGCVEFSVQAENLSDKALFMLPVKIKILGADTKLMALKLLN